MRVQLPDCSDLADLQMKCTPGWGDRRLVQRVMCSPMLRQFVRSDILMELLIQHLYCFLQEDTDGTLFNLLDFFPSEDCFSMLGGPFMKEILGNRNVVGDVMGKRGSLQKAIAELLSDNPNTFYYVNAEQIDAEKFLFKYGDTDNSAEELFHYNKGGGDDKRCLVVRVDDTGHLETLAVSCDDKYPPLCVSFSPDNLDNIQSQCGRCNPLVEECKKWVNFQETDGYQVEGAQLCVQPCGGLQTYQTANEFCQVKLHEM